MVTPFEEADNLGIQEGFICSECYEHFSDAQELLSHFKSGHSGNKSLVHDVIIKAKTKIKFKKPIFASPAATSASEVADQKKVYISTSLTYFDYDCCKSEVIQPTVRSHFESFKKIRSSKLERFGAESNRLKIRLIKLLSGVKLLVIARTSHSIDEGYFESTGWRNHAQTIVEWLNDKEVSRCPDCSKTFNAFRRKHHCRLCGSVLCDQCSSFLSLAEAIAIIPAESFNTPQLKAVANAVELNSCDVPTRTQPKLNLRTCAYCIHILKQESAKIHNSSCESVSSFNIQRDYETLQGKKKEIENLKSQYQRMAHVLKKGSYILDGRKISVEEAQELRAMIIKESEKLEMLSKQFVTVNTGGYQSLLCQRIRQSCVAFIGGVLILPTLPADDDTMLLGGSYLRGKEEENGKIKMIEGWSADISPTRNQPRAEQLHTGFDQSYDDIDHSDPINQQIFNVKTFIQQAKAAGKDEEVVILEDSLKELIEFKADQTMKAKQCN